MRAFHGILRPSEMVIKIHPARYGSSDLVLTEPFRHLPLAECQSGPLSSPQIYHSCRINKPTTANTLYCPTTNAPYHHLISMAKVEVKSEAAKVRKKRCRKNHRRKVRATRCRSPPF